MKFLKYFYFLTNNLKKNINLICPLYYIYLTINFILFTKILDNC
jgi:hypothetical protein